MVPVQVVPYTPTLPACVRTQKHRCCHRLWDNSFLIGAFAPLIYLFFLKYNRIQCCDYQPWPKAACTSVLGIWTIFLVILWPRVNAQAHLLYSRFVYTDRWPVVHNHGPQNPFLSFSPAVLNLQLHLYFLSVRCGVSPQPSFHFLMCESDRALRSSWRRSPSRLKEAQALAQLFQSLFVCLCVKPGCCLGLLRTL